MLRKIDLVDCDEQCLENECRELDTILWNVSGQLGTNFEQITITRLLEYTDKLFSDIEKLIWKTNINRALRLSDMAVSIVSKFYDRYPIVDRLEDHATRLVEEWKALMDSDSNLALKCLKRAKAIIDDFCIETELTDTIDSQMKLFN